MSAQERSVANEKLRELIALVRQFERHSNETGDPMGGCGECLRLFEALVKWADELSALLAVPAAGEKCRLCQEGMPLKKYLDGSMRHFDGLMAWHPCGSLDDDPPPQCKWCNEFSPKHLPGCIGAPPVDGKQGREVAALEQQLKEGE